MLVLFCCVCRSRRQSARKANANRRISWHAIESLLGDKCAIVVRATIDTELFVFYEIFSINA
jgi:hypothetical protein